jgi:hypothetical protein
MSSPSITITFEHAGVLSMSLATSQFEDAVPEWTQLKNFPCPGNIEHGPMISYCRLGAEIDKLVTYFSHIESLDEGTLTLTYGKCMETRIQCDAQTVFYNAVWVILLYSNCSVFKFNQWARSNYMLTIEPERMFYTLFSIFLTEDYAVYPDTPPNLDKFKEELDMLQRVLNNLLERLRQGRDLESDSVCNGLILLSNLILLIDMNFDLFLRNLQKRIKTGSVLEKWAKEYNDFDSRLKNRLLYNEYS